MASAYYASNGEVTVRNRTVQGLGLPEEVLEKLYFRNAEAWLPGGIETDGGRETGALVFGL